MATNRDGQPPRAMIHKQILDKAEADQDASMDTIADEVAGASVDLVEKVLNEYGDPAEESHHPTDPGGDEPLEAQLETPDTDEATDPTAQPSLDNISAKQRETLAEINERPAATQREISKALGVSAATIRRQLNDIAGFWRQDRRDFVAEFFESPLIGDGKGTVQSENAGALESRVEALERRLEGIESSGDKSGLPPS